MPFATKDYDTHGAFVTDTFTARTSGKYRVSSKLQVDSGATWAAADAFRMEILKNGSMVSAHWTIQQASHSTNVVGDITDVINLLEGDTIKINCIPTKASAGDVSMSTSAGYNTFAIERVGN